MGRSEAARTAWRWVRTHRAATAGILLCGLAAALVALFVALQATTAPSRDEALRAFRRGNRQVAPSRPASDVPSPLPTAPTSPAASQPAAPHAPTSMPGAAPAPSQAAASEPAAPCTIDCAFSPPAAGVYEWFQCGRAAGQCTGDASEPPAFETFQLVVPVTRPFPRTGFRTITVSDANHWRIAHTYAAEHREQFDLEGDATGIRSPRYHVDVSVLGIATSREIGQVPPFPAYRFPLAAGQIWTGRWDDPNGNVDAEYTTTVVGQEELRIDGTPVRTWLVETRLDLLGPRVRGTARVRSWYAPALAQSVQEAQEQDAVDDTNIPYRAAWMVTLARLEPQR